MQRRKILAITLALIAVAAAAVSWYLLAWPTWWAQRQLDDARALVAASDTAAARSHLYELVVHDPRHREGRLLLAELELETGRYEHAYLQLKPLTELHPDSAFGWLGLARMYLAGRALDDAETALSQAIAARDDPQLRLQRADLRLRLGRVLAAHQDARHLVEVVPRLATAWLLLVDTTARLEGHASARAVAATLPGELAPLPDGPLAAALEHLRANPIELRAALEVLNSPAQDPNQAGTPPPPPALRARRPVRGEERWGGELQRLRGELEEHLRAQDWPAAETVVSRARQRYAQTHFGPWLAGILALARGEIETAIVQLQQARRLAPRSPMIVEGLGKAWQLENGGAHAGRQLREIAQQEPGFTAPLELAVHHFLAARSPAEAERTLRLGLEMQPDSPGPRIRLAEFFLRLDQPGQAREVVAQARDRFPDTATLERLAASLLARSGDTDRAIAAFAAVVERDPLDEEATAALIRLLLQRGEDPEPPRRALELANRLAFNAPQDPAIQAAVGWAWHHAGLVEQALPWLRTAVAGAPASAELRYHLAAALAAAGEPARARQHLATALESGQPFAAELDARQLWQRLKDTATEQAPSP